ncbi:50S ribosomal protein L32 [Halolamina sp. CBA1230]|uniref:50S ribosomal protein L32 n=1 Tax=Halolamina sp. CBA1230 TaxID=1853690 RepID=UPI00117A7FD9|nr:50S ribosomal protein L32 [Halolamina sp. CBA1230]QKY19792.1 50S ribosomal protein L32 [Halolamina sp. CBA1230]
MPTNDSDADGCIDNGDRLTPHELVVCPACGEQSTDTRTCDHCGHELDDGTGVARSFTGP